VRARKARIWMEDNWVEIALVLIFLVEMAGWTAGIVPYTVIRSLCMDGMCFLVILVILELFFLQNIHPRTRPVLPGSFQVGQAFLRWRSLP
jgi:hypothetical protein